MPRAARPAASAESTPPDRPTTTPLAPAVPTASRTKPVSTRSASGALSTRRSRTCSRRIIAARSSGALEIVALGAQQRQLPAQPVDLAQVDLGDQEVLVEIRRALHDFTARPHDVAAAGIEGALFPADAVAIHHPAGVEQRGRAGE